MRKQNKSAAAAAAVLAAVVMLGGCSLFNESSTTETSATTVVSAERRTMLTTKTAVEPLSPDNDDEGLEGYTTTTTVTGHLDTDVSFDDGYDMDIRATMTKKGEETAPPETTTTTVTTTTTTRKTTTTALKKDTLYAMPDEAAYSSPKEYKVKSDTTYLNLRNGPSRRYDVQLEIPDGADVTGYGKMKESASGEEWVYIDYNGTKGWVMRKLLSD